MRRTWAFKWFSQTHWPLWLHASHCVSCHQCDRRAVLITVSGAKARLIGLTVARYQQANDLCNQCGGSVNVKHAPGISRTLRPARPLASDRKTQYPSIPHPPRNCVGTIQLDTSSGYKLCQTPFSHVKCLPHGKPKELREDVPPHCPSYRTPVVVDRPLSAVQVQLLTQLWLAQRHITTADPYINTIALLAVFLCVSKFCRSTFWILF